MHESSPRKARYQNDKVAKVILDAEYLQAIKDAENGKNRKRIQKNPREKEVKNNEDSEESLVHL